MDVGLYGAEDFADNVALEAADDLGFRAAFGGAALDVDACAGVVAESAQDDPLEGGVGGSVAATVEAVTCRLA